jgi:hypothetical protein
MHRRQKATAHEDAGEHIDHRREGVALVLGHGQNEAVEGFPRIGFPRIGRRFARLVGGPA